MIRSFIYLTFILDQRAFGGKKKRSKKSGSEGEETTDEVEDTVEATPEPTPEPIPEPVVEEKPDFSAAQAPQAAE